MAGNQIGTHVEFNFVNSKKAIPLQNGNNDLTDASDYISINAMFTFLAGFDPITYTSAVLENMSVNDLVFAVRSIEDPTSISNYHPAQVART